MKTRGHATRVGPRAAALARSTVPYIWLLVLLLTAFPSLAAPDRIERRGLPGGGRLRIELRELGADAQGIPRRSASYFYENPETGADEVVGVAPVADVPPAPVVARSGQHIDIAVGNRVFSRRPRFQEWVAFDARPDRPGAPSRAGAAVARRGTEARPASAAVACRIRAITHPGTLRVECGQDEDRFDSIYRRQGFEGLWRLDVPAEPAPRLALPERDVLPGPFPLHAAIRARDAVAFLAAVDAGEDLDRRDDSGETPLQLALDSEARGMIWALLWHGADPLASQAAGEAPGAQAARSRRGRAASGREVLRRRRWAEVLASAAGGELALPARGGAQAELVVGVFAANEALVRRAVAAGADPSWPLPPDGRTLLHQMRNAEVARWLIELGADLDRRDGGGRTPLMQAIAEPALRVAKALLAAGARTDLEDASGRTALEIAAAATKNAGTSTVALLLRHGAAATPAAFEAAAASRNPDTLRLLFRHGGAIDPDSPEGESFYRTAVRHGGEEIESLLRSHPVWGPAYQRWDREHRRQRDREMRRLALSIGAYAFAFGFSTGLLALIVAGCVTVWTARPRTAGLATVALSILASCLAYYTATLRLGLAEFRFFGERVESLPWVYLALVVLAAAVSGAAASYGACRARVFAGLRREPLARLASLIVLLSLFAVLMLHNSGRIETISRAHAGMVGLAKLILKPLVVLGG